MTIFKNKIALITGASGEIGKEIAFELNNKGASIILAGRRREVLNNIGKNLKGDVKIIDESIDNFSNFEKALISCGANIDILINNAGITKDNLILRMKTDQWNDVINLNLNSNFYIIKSILPNMIKNKYGKIIGITSVVALTGNPGQTNYTASKAGLISMYKSLSIEVAQRNININLIVIIFVKIVKWITI